MQRRSMSMSVRTAMHNAHVISVTVSVKVMDMTQLIHLQLVSFVSLTLCSHRALIPSCTGCMYTL
jgi:hypothetical protein